MGTINSRCGKIKMYDTECLALHNRTYYAHRMQNEGGGPTDNQNTREHEKRDIDTGRGGAEQDGGRICMDVGFIRLIIA